jgi:hypothetical protein
VAIGALVGIGAIIAAGIYIPRKMFTHADPNSSAFPPAENSRNAVPPPVAPPSTPPPTAADAVPSASITADQNGVAVQNDKGNIKVDPRGNVTIETPNGSINTSSGGNVSISRSKKNATPGDAGSSGAVVSNAPPAPVGPSPEEIAKAEDEADKLNIRGATVSQSIDTLRQQQQASGYGLRGDIVSSQERMKAYLAKGNSALQAKDLASAKKYFDLADGEISKLEKFLGH